jgi:hypothetical protein
MPQRDRQLGGPWAGAMTHGAGIVAAIRCPR